MNLQGSADELLHILTKRDNPRLALNTERATNGVPNDEGVDLLTDVQLSCDSTSSVFQSHGYSRAITCTPTPTGGCEIRASIAEMLTGITDSGSAISGTFNNGTDYSMTLTVGNGYESTSATVSILKSFANVHMSGKSTGGVCFGGFSSAEEGSPKFECYFPAYFYSGVRFTPDVVTPTRLTDSLAKSTGVEVYRWTADESRFVIIYFYYTIVTSGTANTIRLARVYVNDVLVGVDRKPPSSTLSQGTITVPIVLNAGDVVRVTLYQNSSATGTVNSDTGLKIFKM